MIKKVLIAIFVLFSAVFLGLLTPAIMRTAKPDIEKNKLLANHLYDSLSIGITKPVIISKFMASDTLLQYALKNEESMSEVEMASIIAEYLASIKEKFGYEVAFVISEKTHRYYTINGISKIVNPQKDPYDSWYQLFLESGKNFRLEPDRGEVYDYRWAVFVNVRLEDSDENLLGVCGVGVFMDEMQSLLSKCEAGFGVKINLVDKEGLVQVDTDSTNINNAYISEVLIDKASQNEFSYMERNFGGFRMVRYIEDLDWYLVIQNIGLGEKALGVMFLVGAAYFFLLAVLLVNLYPEKIKKSRHFESTDDTEDYLTGLPNRNYLKNSFGELGIFNTTRYKTLVIFDIDRFKVENETKDGDMILIGVVERAKNIIGDRGIMFRWSGDEFVIFYEAHADEAERKFTEFCTIVKEDLDVSVSVGVVEVNLSESIKTNYHRAVQLCYGMKAAGGNGVKREL